MAANLTLNPLSGYMTASTTSYTALPGSTGRVNSTLAATNGASLAASSASSGSVSVSISAEAMAMAKMSQASDKKSKDEPAGNGTKDNSSSAQSTATDSAGNKLKEEDQRTVQKLKDTDTMVHQHEQAHMAAGGSLVRGGAHYEYKKGPDGKAYAVAGEVSIDMSKVANDPAATIRKAEQIKRAALAPANPSSQDRSVASEADAMESEARVEQQKKSSSGSSDSATKTNSAKSM